MPDVRDAILISLKPDLFLKKLENKEKVVLELVILKIINKVARLGLNMKAIFEEWDKDGNGHCKCSNDVKSFSGFGWID